MQMKKGITKKLYAVTLAAGFALASIGIPEVIAKDRGNSGLPPGPGNPIAQVYKMVLELQQMINAIAPQEGDLWIDHIGFNSNNLDLALLNDGSGGLDMTLISPATSASAVLATGLQAPPGFDVQR